MALTLITQLLLSTRAVHPHPGPANPRLPSLSGIVDLAEERTATGSDRFATETERMFVRSVGQTNDLTARNQYCTTGFPFTDKIQ